MGVKITDLPEQLAPTTDAVIEIVNDPSGTPVSQRVPLSALPGSAASLKITYTGTPQTPLILAVASDRIVVVPSVAVAGQAEYEAIEGVVIDTLRYSENSAEAGNRLLTISFDDLVGVRGNFNPSGLAALTTLACPALINIGGDWSPGTMAALTVLDFPMLARISGNLSLFSASSLVELSLDSVQFIGGIISIGSASSLQTISLAGLVSLGSTVTIAFGLGNVENVTLGTPGTLKALGGAAINISGQKLTVASVNAILALLVSLDGTNGTTLWGSGKTLTINGGTNAAPSGQGVTDKATLQGRGATITTN